MTDLPKNDAARPAIAAADIGSVMKGNFGWAVQSPRGDMESGEDIHAFVYALAELIDLGFPLALGFECPLFVPVREDPRDLTRARKGEGSRPWSAGGGSGALATGLTQVSWILRQIHRSVSSKPNLTLDWSEFDRRGGLLLWEAFVSGASKSQTHAGDAELAVNAFHQALPDPPCANLIAETSVLSLVGACAQWAGWPVNAEMIRQPCLVISA